jgi:uncharacterized protein YwgA
MKKSLIQTRATTVVASLIGSNNKPITSKTIATWLESTHGVASQTVRNLINRGLIISIPNGRSPMYKLPDNIVSEVIKAKKTGKNSEQIAETLSAKKCSAVLYSSMSSPMELLQNILAECEKHKKQNILLIQKNKEYQRDIAIFKQEIAKLKGK